MQKKLLWVIHRTVVKTGLEFPSFLSRPQRQRWLLVNFCYCLTKVYQKFEVCKITLLLNKAYQKFEVCRKTLLLNTIVTGDWTRVWFIFFQLCQKVMTIFWELSLNNFKCKSDIYELWLFTLFFLIL